MKAILLAATALLTVGGALAQQQQLTTEQKQQVEALIQKWVDAINRADPQSFRNLFAKNAVNISAFGIAQGEEIGSPTNPFWSLGAKVNAKFDRAMPIGDGKTIIAVTNYTTTFTNNPMTKEVSGNSLLVLEQQSGQWKIIASSSARAAAASERR